MTSRLSTLFTMVMLVVAAASLPAKAVILSFNVSDGVTGSGSLDNYGDNVNSTSQGTFTYDLTGSVIPNIGLDFTSPSGIFAYYSDATWTGVIYNDGRYITFTPTDADTSVKINDLKLEGYNPQSISYLKVVTFDAHGVENGVLDSVVSGATPVASGPTGTLFAVNYTGAPGQTIGLTFGGSVSQVGIDSLGFSEVSPEPASMGLMGVGSLLLLRRKRR